jgi:predicted secreted protein
VTEHRLTPADDGRSLAVDSEDVVVLELPEQAGTGYQWTVEASGAAAVHERPADGDPGAPGAGRTRVFEVRPGSGRTRVTATKARSWETTPPLERLAVELERR